MFSRRAAKCRGPTLGHQRKQPSASTTVVVHLVESSRSPSDRSHEGIARGLRNRFARHHIVFRESFLVVIASHVVGSIPAPLAAATVHRPPLIPGAGRDSARELPFTAVPCTTFAAAQLHGVWSSVSLGHAYISASG